MAYYSSGRAAKGGGARSIIQAAGKPGVGWSQIAPGGKPRGGSISPAQQALSNIEKSDAEAKAANEKRYAEAMAKYKQIESIYSPGGQFGKGYAAYLAGAKQESVAQGGQALVGAGLAGTTQMAGLGTQWDKQVGAPKMAEFQDMRMGRYAEAMKGTAGLIERREDVGPDYGMIAQLMSKINA